MAGAIQGGWHLQAGLWPQRPLSQQIGIPLAPQKRPIAADCDEHFFTQTLDHFRHSPDGGEKTFQQRYFICNDYWDPAGAAGAAGAAGGNIRSSDGGGSVSKRRRRGENARNGAKGPIFFYAGNEADVTLYVEATGLMWENAPAFGALLVFAEHRFYGESLPFGAPDKGREFLSTSQALADYARLITSLRRELEAETTPVIAFGGSYGGMLAAWLRLKYPHLVQGAVAASAPVLAVEGLRRPTPDPESFAETVTRAAGPAGGAAEECSANIRRAFAAIFAGAGAATGSTPAAAAAAAGDVVVGSKLRDLSDGLSPGAMTRDDARSFEPDLVVAIDTGGNADAGAVADTAVDRVARLLRVCPDRTPAGEGALEELAWWARAAFDYLAMGNYPYPTGYILNGGRVELPAWPLREACSRVSGLPNVPAGEDDDEMLLKALANAIGIYYNATGDLECFSPDAGANNASTIDAQNWNWQACTEMSMPMSTDGKRDMFWSAPWDPDAQAVQCLEQFGVSPREGWAAAEYGGYDSWSQVSNIVFSNGKLDPWSGMGVVDAKQAGPGVRVIMMDKAAHHLDLFFAHPLDPQEVSLARREEMDLVEKWVEEAYLVDASTSTESEGGGDAAVSHPDGEIRGVSAASSGEQKRSSPLLSWLDRFPALVADW